MSERDVGQLHSADDLIAAEWWLCCRGEVYQCFIGTDRGY